GFLIGRVFCDRDGDGKPGPGEEGVFGARVYIDTGWYAVTDESGKYHLKEIPPGVHLVKIDTATLPAGSTMTTDESHIIWFTKGLPAKANFGVRCSEIDLGPDEVKPKAGAAKVGKAKTSIKVAGDLETFTLAVDGTPVPLLATTAIASKVEL